MYFLIFSLTLSGLIKQTFEATLYVIIDEASYRHNNIANEVWIDVNIA